MPGLPRHMREGDYQGIVRVTSHILAHLILPLVGTINTSKVDVNSEDQRPQELSQGTRAYTWERGHLPNGCPTPMFFPVSCVQGGSHQSTGPGEKGSTPGLPPIPWIWGKEEAGPIFPSPVLWISCRAWGSPEALQGCRTLCRVGGSSKKEVAERKSETDRHPTPSPSPFPLPSSLSIHNALHPD